MRSQTLPDEGQGEQEMDTTAGVTVEYGEQVFDLQPGSPFDIGREADLSLADNRFLHRRFLRIVHEHGFWWLVNIGSSIAATVSDPHTGTQAWLRPGARLPLTFRQLVVVFTAGPCTYEIVVHNAEPIWQETVILAGLAGETTVAALPLTPTQKQLIVALAEPMLLREGSGVITIPSNMEAAKRLGWPMTRFNRKLDNVCDKLDRLGVDGLRGGLREHATNRRARLIEFAVSAGLVTAADLDLLNEVAPDEDDDVVIGSLEG
jgi:hypothetical protein